MQQQPRACRCCIPRSHTLGFPKQCWCCEKRTPNQLACSDLLMFNYLMRCVMCTNKSACDFYLLIWATHASGDDISATWDLFQRSLWATPGAGV